MQCRLFANGDTLFIYFYFPAGKIKSYGIVMEKTVEDFSTQLFVVSDAFALQLSTCLLLSKYCNITIQDEIRDVLLALNATFDKISDRLFKKSEDYDYAKISK